ncbi:MAG: AEC family transporter [Alphaproteobacteria bacterium]
MVPALMSVFLMIALGAVLKQAVFQDEPPWRFLDRLNYFVFFPTLLAVTLASSDLSDIAAGPIAGALLSGLACAALMVLALRAVLGIPGPQFSSVFQGALRWNGFVAIATGAALAPGQGLAIVAVVVAVLVPLLNILSVIVITQTNPALPTPWRTLPVTLARNPLILACLSGLVLNGQTLLLDSPLGTMAQTLGRAAMPLGLLGVGAGLHLTALKGRVGLILVTITIKLVLMPALFAGFADLYGIEGTARTIMIVCGAVPGATSSYVLARQLGGDATLMAGLVTASTLGALVTMPVMFWLLT